MNIGIDTTRSIAITIMRSSCANASGGSIVDVPRDLDA
jgi:hypothetical protein